MGYLHIDNLYANQQILLFRECYALEKIHGTSAHLSWKDGALHYSSGGEKHERFLALFDDASLREKFAAFGYPAITVYGEAYGGSQQKQAWRYGPELRFVAFDVRIDDNWLEVPKAEDVVLKLGLQFVPYKKVPTDLTALDDERDAPSAQAKRNGVDGDMPREGVVLRPIEEVITKRGNRVIAKHKRDEERETKTPRKVVDPSKLLVLRQAEEIAEEWVTETRLEHVLDKLDQGIGIERTREVISAMLEDVLREGKSEIVDSPEARRSICTRTALLFKRRLVSILKEVAS